MKDYYEILGVSKGASQDEIKRAYRKKARQLHPDYAGPESEDAFKELSVAYGVLSDPEKRQAYDIGGPSAFGQGGGSYSGADFGFADLFETMFGSMGTGGFASSRGPVPRGRRGQDILVGIEVELDEIVFGTTKEINLETAVLCPTCNGSCCAAGTSPQTCKVCGGTGSVSRVQQSLLGAIRTSVPCSNCQGHGQIIASPCQDCSGDGRIRSHRTLSVNVPAGVENGTRLRLREQGEVGPAGGPAGDIYVEIREQSHPVFARIGADLHTRITVPMTLAALGTVFSLDTFDGEQEVVIKPGTQSEDNIVLKGLGVGRLNGYGRGDLLVHMAVETPQHLDDQQRELLEQLAELREEHRVAPPVSASGGPLKWLKEKLGGQ